MSSINFDTIIQDTEAEIQAERAAAEQEEFDQEFNLEPEEPKQSVWGAVGGWMKRIPKNVGIGTVKAAVHTIETADDFFAVAGEELMRGGSIGRLSRGVSGEPEPDVEALPPLRTMFPDVFESMHQALDAVEQKNVTPTTGSTVLNIALSDDMAQGISQFAVPFTGYLKAFGGMKNISTALKLGKIGVAEGVTAGSAFDAHEGRVADLVVMGQQMENQFGELLNKAAPDGSLVNAYIDWMTHRGPETHDGFPAVQNEDGSFSTEISITVTDPRLNDGKPTNIPSLWEQQVVSEQEAVQRAIESGRSFRSFESIDEAVQAAVRRSERKGREAQVEGEWEGRFKNAVDSVVSTAIVGGFIKGAAVSLRQTARGVGKLKDVPQKRFKEAVERRTQEAEAEAEARKASQGEAAENTAAEVKEE